MPYSPLQHTTACIAESRKLIDGAVERMKASSDQIARSREKIEATVERMSRVTVCLGRER
jgi:hypothetical protein